MKNFLSVFEKNKKNISVAFSVLKSSGYVLEGAVLPLISRTVAGTQSEKKYAQHLQDVLPKLRQLILNEAELIQQGVYPLSVLVDEKPVEHLKRIPSVMTEAFAAAKRKSAKQTDWFEPEAATYAVELPTYYQRNFHFQNNGYLSHESAELYDHQVELLFAGTANTMRRLLIPDVKKVLQTDDGEGMRFLELGSGTGSLTRSMALAFPKAQITSVEISPFYIKKAQEKLKEFNRVDFVNALAEELPFKDGTFDLVYSCYLFHELPNEIRKKVLKESLRVLKEHSCMAVVDSIQMGDDPDLDWALKKFPIDFHEPFYKNYVENPLEQLLSELSSEQQLKRIGFLTKSVVLPIHKM